MRDQTSSSTSSRNLSQVRRRSQDIVLSIHSWPMVRTSLARSCFALTLKSIASDIITTLPRAIQNSLRDCTPSLSGQRRPLKSKRTRRESDHGSHFREKEIHLQTYLQCTVRKIILTNTYQSSSHRVHVFRLCHSSSLKCTSNAAI